MACGASYLEYRARVDRLDLVLPASDSSNPRCWRTRANCPGATWSSLALGNGLRDGPAISRFAFACRREACEPADQALRCGALFRSFDIPKLFFLAVILETTGSAS